MVEFIERINAFVWGIPALVLILGVGVYLTIATNYTQLRYFSLSIRRFLRELVSKGDKRNGSGFQALCTALSATVGTGNIVGVAGAISIGGPGAIFWMWICAFLGMVTKFSEATLAVRYQLSNGCGEYIGGPMYMITKGMGKKWYWMAYVYSILGVVASFGVGNATQVNSMICGIHTAVNTIGWENSSVLDFVIGVFLAILIMKALLGGASRIGRIAEFLVPFVSCGYLVLGAVVLLLRAKYIPVAFRAIIVGAFDPLSITGGVLGSAFLALRTGAARGVFTNEAGMGTAAIAHGSADVLHPVEQGLMGMMEVFLDTIVICTITALVILCSGVQIPYGIDTGGVLTSSAFSSVLGDWTNIFIAISLCLFAFATVLGWGLYGMHCTEFVFGKKALGFFVISQGCVAMFGSIMKTETVWMFAECINGLMALPNLIALIALSPELKRLVNEFQNTRRN